MFILEFWYLLRMYLSFVHLNVQSIFTHFDILKSYILAEVIDIFAVTETWLELNNVPTFINIPNYTLTTADRLGRGGGGGVGFFVKNNVPFKVIFSNISQCLEQLWISVKILGPCGALGAFDCPPGQGIPDACNLFNNTNVTDFTFLGLRSF